MGFYATEVDANEFLSADNVSKWMWVQALQELTQGQLDSRSAGSIDEPLQVLVLDDAELALELNKYDCLRIYAVMHSVQQFKRLQAAQLAVFSPEFALPETSLDLVLLRLPKSVRHLQYLAAKLANLPQVDSETLVVGGGRVKHMSLSQNEALATAFAEVHATRGKGQARCLVARQPKNIAESQPESAVVDFQKLGARQLATRSGSVKVFAQGGTFGGVKCDFGSLLMLEAFAANLDTGVISGLNGAGEERAVQVRVADVGCGNGFICASLKNLLPNAAVYGSDDAWDAVQSTRLTLQADAGDVAEIAERVTWQASLQETPAEFFDLIFINPPFHSGFAVDETLVDDLLDGCERCLKPGGEMWLVYNSHLNYRPKVKRLFAEVSQVARDRRFTVLRAVK